MPCKSRVTVSVTARSPADLFLPAQMTSLTSLRGRMQDYRAGGVASVLCGRRFELSPETVPKEWRTRLHRGTDAMQKSCDCECHGSESGRPLPSRSDDLADFSPDQLSADGCKTIAPAASHRCYAVAASSSRLRQFRKKSCDCECHGSESGRPLPSRSDDLADFSPILSVYRGSSRSVKNGSSEKVSRSILPRSMSMLRRDLLL
jgi:hypothetical protein